MKFALQQLFAYLCRYLNPGYFYFAGTRYQYCIQPNTWKGERVVEVPLMLDFISRTQGKSILEVGNVLANHGHKPSNVFTVDKYDLSHRVLNLDICEFEPLVIFDGLLSISTLEHVGYDEPQFDLSKASRALLRLQCLIKPDAPMLLTIPLGYHPTFPSESDLVGDWRFLQRTEDNRYVERSWSELRRPFRYGYPYPFCNALAIYARF